MGDSQRWAGVTGERQFPTEVDWEEAVARETSVSAPVAVAVYHLTGQTSLKREDLLWLCEKHNNDLQFFFCFHLTSIALKLALLTQQPNGIWQVLNVRKILGRSCAPWSKSGAVIIDGFLCPLNSTLHFKSQVNLRQTLNKFKGKIYVFAFFY